MRVEIRMVNGDSEEILDLSDEDVMNLIDDFQNGNGYTLMWTSELGVTHMARRHIVSILVSDTPDLR